MMIWRSLGFYWNSFWCVPGVETRGYLSFYVGTQWKVRYYMSLLLHFCTKSMGKVVFFPFCSKFHMFTTMRPRFFKFSLISSTSIERCILHGLSESSLQFGLIRVQLSNSLAQCFYSHVSPSIGWILICSLFIALIIYFPLDMLSNNVIRRFFYTHNENYLVVFVNFFLCYYCPTVLYCRHFRYLRWCMYYWQEFDFTPLTSIFQFVFGVFYHSRAWISFLYLLPFDIPIEHA